MEDCEGVRLEKNPVFHTKAGFFLGVLDMNGNLNLKIFLSISLGFHLLFVSIMMLLYPNFKINHFPSLNIEVSLYPLIPETKVASHQIMNSKVRTMDHESSFNVKTQDLSPVTRTSIQEEKEWLRKEKKEESLSEKEKEPESLSTQEEVQVIPISIPLTDTSKSEKWGMGKRNEEGVVKGLVGDLSPLTSSSSPSKVAMKHPSLSDGEVLFVQPKYVENPKPVYPQEARKKGYEGEVILRVEVLQNGRVGQIDVKKSSGYELLDRSALATVKQWKFVPAQKGEKSIPLWVNIPVKFQLQ
jgi:TonB family protein